MTTEEKIQIKAETHLDACFNTLYDEEPGEGFTPAVAPFCGCTTCVVREVLSVAYEDLLELAREEAK